MTTNGTQCLNDYLRNTRVTIGPLERQSRGYYHRVHAYNEVTRAEKTMHASDMDEADVLADWLLELVGSPRKKQ